MPFTQTADTQAQGDALYTREDMEELAVTMYAAAQYRGKLSAIENAHPVLKSAAKSKFEKYMENEH